MGQYTRTTHDGKTVNKRTKAMLLEAERMLGYELTIVQGSYSTSVSQSAGTHSGGGAVDLKAWDWERKVRALRAVGFAAWYRPTIRGVWTEHIHAIAIGDYTMSDAARRQVSAYYAGRDGLARNGVDTFWRPSPIPVFEYWRTMFVDLSNVRKQFKAEKPRRKAGVKRIQRALNAKLNTRLKIDGIAGPATRRAYMTWEKRLGYAKANHVPNKHSLRLLGDKRFSVKR